MLRINRTTLAFGIPIILSSAAVLTNSALLIAGFFVSHFIIVHVMSSAKGHENVWMFLMVIISSIPINIYVCVQLNAIWNSTESFLVFNILKCILYYTMLLSTEEIIMGVITRFIWKKQYKIRF